MSAKKRNFTVQEKNLLLQILKNYKHIIENKKTDNINAAKKKSAWRAMAEQYNMSTVVTEAASGDQLRRLWSNMKTKKKEAMNKERRFISDGSPCPDNLDADVVPALLVEVFGSNDSDSDPSISQSSTSEIQSFASEIQSFASEIQAIKSETHPVISEIHSITSEIQSITPEIQPITPEIQPIKSEIQPSISDTQSITSNSIQKDSCSEKKLRLQILKQEHYNRERRSEEKHTIELEILKEQLQLAKYKTKLAFKELGNNL